MSILSHDPVRVSDRRLPAAGRGVSRSALVLAQRAELHLDLPDSVLAGLALRAGKAVAR